MFLICFWNLEFLITKSAKNDQEREITFVLHAYCSYSRVVSFPCSRITESFHRQREEYIQVKTILRQQDGKDGVHLFMKKKTMVKQKRCVGQQKDVRLKEARKRE